jgi:large subunit ribosomal protein L22
VTQTMQANQARAVLRYFRMSPTKARQVLDLIRGKSAVEAIRTLSLVNREASEVVGKLLASAVANATVRYGLGADEVFVAQAFADEGPTIKRFRPRARGRATRIRKRSCHITIVVEEMPFEMRRVAAAKSSGRQSARRSQRVASSRAGGPRENQRSLPPTDEAVQPDEVMSSDDMSALVATETPAADAGIEAGGVETSAVETNAVETNSVETNIVEGSLAEDNVVEGDAVEGEVAEGEVAEDVSDATGQAEVAPGDEGSSKAASVEEASTEDSGADEGQEDS